jgi:hypothetical protein
MRCQTCGCNAPTKYVSFHQNIGAVVMRFRKEVKGELCKNCIHSYFWKFTLTTLAVGWLGIISMILAPLFIINNIFYYLGSLGLKSAVTRPPLSEHPTTSLTAEASDKLQPFLLEMQVRLKAGEPLDQMSGAIAQQAGVSAVQVELFAEKNAI